MTNLEETSRPAASLGVAERWLPALLLLFVGSGCAALVYEVVWFQLLQLSIGSSAVSLGVLLGVYMGGMCLGSLLLPRYLSPATHPLRVYALLELGIGLFGVVVLYAVPLIGSWYTAIAGSGPANLVLRAAVAGVCLIPPTLLMGATLPAIARWVETTPRGVSWLGFFYGGNLAGAVAGSLLAGFYLLRVYDMSTATFVAVAINVVVALLALGLAKLTPRTVITGDGSEVRPVAATTAETRLVYVAIALSGLTALGSEVVWTRVLSLIFGATAYTFSLILAVFLVGLGIGSSVGAALAKSARNPREALGWCQVALCAALAWAGYATGASLPYWPINPSISTSVVFTFQLDLVRAFWVMLPGAILWGASFPLALASVAVRGQDSARLVGGVYAANTVGAIVGALVTALALVGVVGSQITQQVLIGVAALSGLLLLGAAPGDARGFRASAPALARVIIVAAAAGLFARAVPPLPGLLVAYGRYAATWVGQNEIIYVGEGVTASVAVSRTPSGTLNYHNAGKVQASSEPQDMRLQRMLGHITTLVPKNPTKVLVIGCGAGVTAGAVSVDPLVKDQTIAEIEPLVPRVVSTYFAAHNFNVVANPKVKVHLDDARHYLLTTNEKFDAVTSDPLDPWVKGAATLYTREFFDVVKSHLNPGGVVTLFVQLYESTEAAAKSEVATFLEAFPNGAVFANTVNGQGYDLVLFGQLENNRIDVDAVQARLADPANAPIAQSLREIGINSAVELFGTYAGRRSDMANWLKDAQINTDRNLKLQYLAGLGLNLYQSDAIYKAMSRESKYPDELFAGSPDTIEALKARITAALGGASF
ncbi:MAG TPA: fused MFS/spermidine synthase [Vicinamibacterales bacterium]|jgi:spermidine synthase|nr:fused MFS/spermidine synthase [Vicinamibacterales bacterium]